MTNIQKVAGFLARSDYPRSVLEPLETPDGRMLVDTPDGPWRAFPYLSPTISKLEASSAEEVFKAAAAVGEWHSFLRELDPVSIQPAIPGFFDVSWRWQQWQEAKAAAAPDRLAQARLEIEQLEAHAGLVDQFVRTAKAGTLPLRLLHGDPKLSNLLFDATTGEVRALIDWDTVQPGWIVFDFGDMVRSYTNAHAEDDPDPHATQVHEPYLQALREGFLSQTASWLTAAEKDHLFTGASWVIWMQALRFLADYLRGDVYYPVNYADHNRIRARNQLSLLESFLFLSTL
jgi:Ser/Thr protein kinase RdoA (MazF antagonist)